MAEIFADTGYWIAMHNPEDDRHHAARTQTDLRQGDVIVTSEMVLVEFLNFCSRQGTSSRAEAAATASRLWRSASIVMISQTSEQLRAAIRRYAERLDQRWSVTDCASFLIMEERGITEALAYDRDFEQAGFRALLREG